MRLSSIGVLAVGLPMLAAPSHARPLTVSGATSWSFTSGTLAITAGSGAAVTVTTTDPLDNIAVTSINVTATTGIVYLTVKNDFGPINSVGSIQQVGGAGELWITDVSNTGTVGAVTATYISQLKPTGNITGAITATGNSGGSPNPVSIESISPVNGNLTGNVSAPNQINSIILNNGNIGTPGGAGITISSTSGDINEVQAESINAAITPGAGKAFRKLFAKTGKFEGSLTAYALAPIGSSDIGIDVKTDLDANITLSQPITGSATAPSIRVGGTFASGKTISLPSNGLAGQIVFNNSISGGAWNGTVSVGGSSPFTSPPYYTNKASTFGGGYVGLASFRFNPQDSFPANGATFNLKHISLTGLGAEPECVSRAMPNPTIAHYGPVRVESVAYDNVDELYAASGPSSPNFSSSTVIANGRGVVLSGPSGGWQVGTYSFDLLFDGNQARLVSDQVDNMTSANSVPDYTYTFTIISDCDIAWKQFYDLNGDGLLTMRDAQQWFATPADFNNNGVIDTGDLVKQLEAISTIGDE